MLLYRMLRREHCNCRVILLITVGSLVERTVLLVMYFFNHFITGCKLMHGFFVYDLLGLLKIVLPSYRVPFCSQATVYKVYIEVKS